MLTGKENIPAKEVLLMTKAISNDAINIKTPHANPVLFSEKETPIEFNLFFRINFVYRIGVTSKKTSRVVMPWIVPESGKIKKRKTHTRAKTTD